MNTAAEYGIKSRTGKLISGGDSVFAPPIESFVMSEDGSKLIPVFASSFTGESEMKKVLSIPVTADMDRLFETDAIEAQQQPKNFLDGFAKFVDELF